MRSLLSLLLFLYTVTAIAEYRVYQYYVYSRFKAPQDQNAYLVTSTLDPEGYYAYNGGKESIKIDLLRTWYCPGNTANGKEYCPSPLETPRSSP